MSIATRSQSAFCAALSVLCLSACSLSPRVQLPPTLGDLRSDTVIKAWGKDADWKAVESLASCASLLAAPLPPVGDRDAPYPDRLAAAKHRARCVQQQLAKKLRNVERMEVGSRAALQTLALGASAAGFYGGSDGLIAALGLGAGAVAGVRAFQPLDARERLYFYAIGALECSIMTADSLGRDGELGLAEEVFVSLLDSPQGGSGSKLGRMSPEVLAEKPDANGSLREILFKRLRLMASKQTEQCGDGATDQGGARDTYADYLRSDSDFMRAYEDKEPSCIVPALSQIPLDGTGKETPEDRVIRTLLTTSVARTMQANEAAVESFVTWFDASRRAVRHAPEDLDAAVTLVTLAVNKALVEETPDTAQVRKAVDQASAQIFADVKAGRERFKVVDESQKKQVDAARQTGMTLQSLNTGEDSVKKVNQALEDVTMTLAKLDAIVRLTESKSDHPAACRALFNGSGAAEQPAGAGSP